MAPPRLAPLAALLIACGSPGAPRPPSAPAAAPVATRDSTPAAARQLAADTPITTGSGASLRVPGGWWLTEARDAITLEDPDRTLRITLVETATAEPLAAIAEAWRRARPGVTATARGEPEAPPPTGGWDATTRLELETSAAAHPIASALARRFGATTYVALIEAAVGATERREAQLDIALGSLRPAGMAEESFVGRPVRALDATRTAALDAFIADALASLEVPGAAVAVIVDGKVVYERAFGVRTLGRPAPVTVDTLFLIASITKPMTTMMQATLVDAGALTWDTPVTTLLPSFALGDAEVTRKVALWHMSCACTGMPRQDLEDIFEYAAITPEQRVASMRTMTPTTGFGETFQYSNLMVAAGGFAAAHAFAPRRALGDAYADAMRTKIFAPIGMRSTTLDIAAVARADHATPHALAIDGTPRALPLAIERAVVPIAPAGGVWSNLRDLERYVMTELADGIAPGGRRVVSAQNLRERRTLRMPSGPDGGYGLGLGVSSFHGLPSIGHDGGAFGYGTTMFMLPEQQLGIIILTNVRNGGGYQQLPFNAAVQRRLVEALFDAARERAGASVAYYRKAKRDAATAARTGVEPAPAAWTATLAGTYVDPGLGRAVIAGDRFDAGEWSTRFGRRTEADGTVTLVFLDPPFAGASLFVDGDPARPTLRVDAGQAQYRFVRTGR